MSIKQEFTTTISLLLCVTLLFASFTTNLHSQTSATDVNGNRIAAENIRAPELTEGAINGTTTVRLLDTAEAERLANLREQIDERNKQIRGLEEKIKEQEKNIRGVSGKRKTLEDEVRRLNLVNQRDKNRILLTQENIRKKNLEISTLRSKISSESQSTILLKKTLGELIRFSNEIDNRNPYLTLLTEDSVFDSVQQINTLNRLNDATVRQVASIQQSVNVLQKDKNAQIVEQRRLNALKSELDDRQAILQISANTKRSLLRQTKNEETRYQTLLQETRNELAAILNDIRQAESQIRFFLDPTSLPKPAKGVLRQPVVKRFPFTQRFGRTAFATRNSHLYGRAFHDGLDFGTPTGSVIVAVDDATVVATGNTGLVRSCRVWGKWILLEHRNGLSTLYAHLSLIKVFPGQEVKRGQLIGYSGNTGNSTGPHLHLGLYVSEGIKVVPYESFSKRGLCNGLSLPLAADKAKLDPLPYIAQHPEPQVSG